VEALDERDVVSITVFDQEVQVILPAAPAAPEHKKLARSRLEALQSGGQTALHQGWLTGCQSIASEKSLTASGGGADCFLLTDGLANVGETDVEKIAADAAGVRQNAGIRISTFGVGPDYDEGLLAPMAVSGGGQFHHLRDEREIATTFSGALAELFRVVARRVTLCVAPEAAQSTTQAELISEYHASPLDSMRGIKIDVGDLIAGEERHIVVRLRIPGMPPCARAAGGAWLEWLEADRRQRTPQGEIVFEGADAASCDREARDPAVLHWVGLHHATRTEKLAMYRLRDGDQAGALGLVVLAIERLSKYAAGDPDLVQALEHLHEIRRAIE
jgi:Ca-activated chloride channel family protein